MGRNQIMIWPFAERGKEVLLRKATPVESKRVEPGGLL